MEEARGVCVPMEVQGFEFQGGATTPDTLDKSPGPHPPELAMIFQCQSIIESMRNGDGEKQCKLLVQVT